MAALVEFECLRPEYVVPREVCPGLGTFLIREKDHLLGYGVVEKVTEAESDAGSWGSGRAGAQKQRGKKGGGRGRKDGSQENGVQEAQGAQAAAEAGARAGGQGSSTAASLLSEILS